MKTASLVLRLLAAIILAQTLFFKFTAAPESVYIFSTLGVEPWGRLFAGFSELIAVGLLLVPATRLLGALAAIGIMMGAILSHIFVLGIVVENDGGELFALALTVTIACFAVLYIERKELEQLIGKVLQIAGIRINGLP